MNAPLAEMFRYNRWANLTLLAACRALDDATLDARVPGVSGSVRELLLHIVGGEQTFVLRTTGRQHEGELSRGSAWPGFDVLQDIANRTSDDLIRIAEGLTTDRPVDLLWMGKAYRYPTSFFLLHALEHGVEHRTEIKLALAQRGIATPDLDAWEYAPTAGFGAEVDPGTAPGTS
ncbi:MAG TPA: DinB family protein [Thermomicrobiaceae bacterium]|nr:DinB family protein [Thermomicrobiaceae bacterium]